ncbi:glycosyltransferase [Patescibacteria group bacterium]|nr:glycosyltransferase [Patescibacteria group bacterium]
MSSSKILFMASYAPPAISGAAQNMYNLIEALPPESYYMMTSFYNIDSTMLRLGRWLSGTYLFYDRVGATKEQLQAQANQSQAPTGRRGFATRLKTAIRRSKAMGTLTGIPVIALQVIDMVRCGRQAIRERDVRLLVGFSDYGPTMISVYYIHRVTRLPFRLFMFDIYKGNDFFFPGNLIANWLEPRLMRAAQMIIVNNEGTRQFYIKRYGSWISDKLRLIHNSSDPAAYLALQTTYQPRPPYTILFTGSIYWPQIRSLQNLVRAVENITDLEIRIKLYAPHSADYLAAYNLTGPKIDVSVASPTEMAKLQSQADILFLPLSWETKSPGIIGTATPGKLTDYLVAGRPILIHSPEWSHLSQYAKANGFAEVVDQESIAALQTAIRRLLTDVGYAQELIAKAQRTFFANHTTEKNAAAFRSLFAQSAID